MPEWRRYLPSMAGRSWSCVLAFGFATAIAVAAPASATVLTPTPDALPGSSFQGADGDQDDAPALMLIDWQARQAARRVRHTSDANDRDTAFTGGSKELKPGEWGLREEAGGVNPAKDNIRDVWSSVSQPGANTFVQLGFTREKEEGTTFLTFELNHDARLWHNGKARIPCRRTGDVLVSYEVKGNDVDVVIQRWITESTDAASGCAQTGRLDEYTGFTRNVAQGAINDTAIASRLPGAYNGTVPRRRFGEAALNLARLVAEGFGTRCLAFASVWAHSRSSTSEESNMQDYVAPESLKVRTCAASGTKFFDLNANGVRDSDDPGIPRFKIWADYNDDGVHDRGEPFSVSDNQGQYVIYDIKPPDGIYRLREKLLTRRARTRAVATDWICSYPNAETPGATGDAPNGRFGCASGLIDANRTPYAEGHDFGNWFPARLTVRKELEPAGDPGRFNLPVNGRVVLPAAGDGARITLSVPPGTYDVSEIAAAGTNAADYRSTVECRRSATRRGRRLSATVFEDLELSAGQRAVCTFRNIRLGVPAIAIRKTGPGIAQAGDTLRYTFEVTNPGDVPFPEDAVRVSDSRCVDPPELVEKDDASGADDSPGTLDPGDTYRCSNGTDSGGDACEPIRIDNTGTVTGTTAGSTVTDDDSISTIILCPDGPSPPIPEPPGPPRPDGPDEPGAVVPPGPAPPNAGDAAVASFVLRRATRGCISGRVPRVDFSGTRIRRIRVYANGRLRRGLTVRTLQRRVTPRVTLAPGRYRLAVRVVFQRGSGSPPVRLTRAIRICAAAAPPVTG